MTPPLTGFFMKIAGLGDVHKEIERRRMNLAPDLQTHGKMLGPSKERLPPERPADSGGTYRHHGTMSTLHLRLTLSASPEKNA